MSLINEMLRDLEARGGRAPDDDLRLAPLPRAKTMRPWPLYFLVGIVLILGAALVFVLQSADRTTPIAATFVTTPAAVPATRNVPPDVVSAEAPRDETASLAEKATPPAAADKSSTAPVDPAPVPVEADQRVGAAETAAGVQENLAASSETTSIENESVVVRRHAPTPAEKAARASRDGFAAMRSNDWTTAARLLQELVAIEPANDDGREALVIALSRQGRISEADGVALDGIAIGANPARFAKLRARMQSARGDVAAALDSLAVAIPSVSADPEFHALKGAFAQQVGRYALAEEIYVALTAFEPANATWLTGLAMALDQQGKSAEAMAAYERALDAGHLEAPLLAHVQRRLEALKQD